MAAWVRQDTLTPKQRKEMKENFLNSLKNDSERKWKSVVFNDIIVPDYVISNDGILASLRMRKFMKPAKGTSGYWATVIRINGEKVNVAIHRLVAEAFIPNPENKPEVNHKNGNKDKNCDWNLEWVTHVDNIDHAIKTGLRLDRPAKKYSKKKIRRVCGLLEAGEKVSKISKITGVSKSVIRSVKRGSSWKSISKHYHIPLDVNARFTDKYEEQASTTIESDPDGEYIIIRE